MLYKPLFIAFYTFMVFEFYIRMNSEITEEMNHSAFPFANTGLENESLNNLSIY